MDEITSGGKAFKDAWMALPRERKKVVIKAVQSGREVTEETAIAAGYASRQIKTSWLGYIGIIVLAFAINLVQGEDLTGTPLTWAILILIVAIGIYSYMRLFQSRTRNLDLLAARAATPGSHEGDDGAGDEAEEEQDIERLQGEGGPVTEVPEPHPHTPPTPPTPSTPVGRESDTTGE